MSKIVHALLAGKPLCNFSDSVPAQWPHGHIWTTIKHAESITCPSCKKEAERIRKNWEEKG